MSVQKFTVDFEMEERWIPHFLSMLKRIQSNSQAGHSSVIAFYADGDGDCRFTANPSIEFEVKAEAVKNQNVKVEYLFDAG